MPIYAYRCSSCGHEKDVLQKMSDPLLTICPECKAESFSKQVTAAGFQLKGNGWYATDFKNGSQPAKTAESSTTTTPVASGTTTESKATTPAASPTPASSDSGKTTTPAAT